MANTEQIKILRQGVAVWNRWRAEQPGVEIDLSNAILRRITLNGVNFRGANLCGASLRHSHFNNADFSNSTLQSVDMAGAYLDAANFQHARLHALSMIGAYLRGANLSHADLTQVDLSHSDLNSADLSFAALRDTSLHNSNLSNAVLHAVELDNVDVSKAEFCRSLFSDLQLDSVNGLNAGRHSGPSSLDSRCLQRSSRLPLSFLRGFGLNDLEIAIYHLHQPASSAHVIDSRMQRVQQLREQGVSESRFYISGSAKNNAFAKQLTEDLQEAGIRCWFTPEYRKSGTKIGPDLKHFVNPRERVLLILSKPAILNTWVDEEVESLLRAEKEGQILVLPISLDNYFQDLDRPWAHTLRGTRSIPNFCDWQEAENYSRAFLELLELLS